MNSQHILIGAMSLLLMLTACAKSEKEQAVQIRIQAEIEARVAQGIQQRKQACQKQIIVDALRQVDSLIVQQLRLMHEQEQMRPKRFPKPGSPQINLIEDTIHLRPLWPDSLQLYDSLLYYYLMDSAWVDSFMQNEGSPVSVPLE